ncbi:uncharacterized protein LOC9659601 [Selaginella moellendorffii]|uniref:uncharacterized protein LOC9659601 n=1 Tax=Selaginella moellendorffii TaxID=88036 RepID=UPI000D1C8D2E|nr:uncharacterized protein LOC9659601 [Selaginella moellendorffii]XP_024539811.1 uncharacterized protein LOC9659601 [Selaginella moellendorffii]|eukprot:XP_002979096.2 uncharacterized protein LOC9659601 [Selaginella moellendorffii]
MASSFLATPSRHLVCSNLSARGVKSLRTGIQARPLHNLSNLSSTWKKNVDKAQWKAVLQEDAPYAVAIGACVLSSLVLPSGQTKPDGSVFGPDDVRYAAMGIISFIPLFDWLAWVFAWLDTSKRKYLIFSIVYLAPYLKSGMSLSTDDSWLPLASVLACILHVQLEIAVNNQSLEEAQIKENITRMLFEKTRIKELRDRGTGLLSRLQNLAEQSAHAEKPEDFEHEATNNEFETWDEKFLHKIKKNKRDEVVDSSEKAKE